MLTLAPSLAPYNAKLQAGLGLMAETQILLELWQPDMSVPDLYKTALESGEFATITARRLRNIVVECFAPRYLVREGPPAKYLKLLLPTLRKPEQQNLFLLFTCRANAILADFIRQVYWARYGAGDRELDNAQARAFIERAIDDGKTVKRWSDQTIMRIGGNLTGCCADYGLLQEGVRKKRRFLPVHLSGKAAVYLAHDLYQQGLNGRTLLNHPDWLLFGMDSDDVLAALKRLALDGWFVVQSGGEIVRISWQYHDMEAVCHVLAQN